MRVDDQHLRVTQILWFALFVSLVIYGAIVWILSRPWPQPAPLSDVANDPLVLALFGAALVNFALGWIIPAKKLEGGASIDAIRAALIVRWALFESVAILGLVAAIIRQNWQLFALAAMLSVAGFVLSFPSRDRFERM